MKAICIVGLPGSGKTYFASQLIKQEQFKDYILFDDLGHSSESFYEFMSFIEETRSNIIVIDPSFCLPSVRESSIKMLSECGYEIEWIYFENNVEKCKANVEYRKRLGDKREVNGYIFILSQGYVIPENIEVKKIWSEKL